MAAVSAIFFQGIYANSGKSSYTPKAKLQPSVQPSQGTIMAQDIGTEEDLSPTNLALTPGFGTGFGTPGFNTPDVLVNQTVNQLNNQNQAQAQNQQQAQAPTTLTGLPLQSQTLAVTTQTVLLPLSTHTQAAALLTQLQGLLGL
jgi:hypothetical protein